MKKFNIHEAKTNLSSLITIVENEQENIMICRAGKPVAILGPMKVKVHKKRSTVMKSLLPKRVDVDLILPVSDDWEEI